MMKLIFRSVRKRRGFEMHDVVRDIIERRSVDHEQVIPKSWGPKGVLQKFAWEPFDLIPGKVWDILNQAKADRIHSLKFTENYRSSGRSCESIGGVFVAFQCRIAHSEPLEPRVRLQSRGLFLYCMPIRQPGRLLGFTLTRAQGAIQSSRLKKIKYARTRLSFN